MAHAAANNCGYNHNDDQNHQNDNGNDTLQLPGAFLHKKGKIIHTATLDIKKKRRGGRGCHRYISHTL